MNHPFSAKTALARILPPLLLALATLLIAAPGRPAQARPPQPPANAPLVNCPAWQAPDSASYQSFPGAGIYAFYDWPHLDPDLYPWLTGGHTVFPWNSVEDEVEGDFYWEDVDQWIAAEAALGKPVGLAFNSYDGFYTGGDWLPAWFKQARGAWPDGDGYVTCGWSDNLGYHEQDIPMYWSDAYLAAFENFVRTAAERYRDDPRLAWVEISVGIYGETTPSESDPELDQCMQDAGLATSADWIAVVNRVADIYQAHWQDKPLLLQYAPIFLDRIERREHTTYAGGLGIGMKYNKVPVDHDDQVVRSDRWDIHPAVCRTGQYDPMLTFAGQVPMAWEGEAVLFDDASDVLWAFINAMNKHPAYLLVGKDLLRSDDPLEQWVMDFVARYAGRTVADTPGVWVALREPLSTWYPQRGNFDFWLRQEDGAPGGQTVAAWDITGHPWGRYTRRTDQLSGNPYMAFDVDDNYLFDNSTAPVTVTVVYLDYGGDTWELQYDAAGAADYQVAGVVQKGFSSQWLTASFLLADAQFAGQQDGYDFRLWSRGDGNEYVSFVEVRKGQGSGCTVQGAGGKGQGARGRVQGAGCRVQGADGEGQGAEVDLARLAPANDDFDSATVIAGFPFSEVLDTGDATLAADDPDMGCGQGANTHTVWHRFTAPGDGFVTISTAGSDYDTVLAAWQGARGALAGRGCNDDIDWWAGSSHLNVGVATGQSYIVETAGRGQPAGGQLALQADFHPCTYAGDQAIVQGVLDGLGLAGFDKFITFAEDAQGARCAITGLALSNKGLSGSPPAAIAGLSNLQRLDLHNNQLNGSPPAWLGELANLHRLDLYDNQLSGPLPAWLGDLAGLQVLNLKGNQFSGPLPAALANLGRLQWLDLHDNQLDGPLPAWLADLADLRELWLGRNQFSGALPASLGQLSRLRVLSLVRNQLSGPLPAELGALPALEYLYLSDNQLSGPLPAAIGDLERLQGLFLDHNRLAGPLPAELGDLSGLILLDLAHNRLDGPLLASLGDLAGLWSLRLDHNLLSGGLPAELDGAGLANLRGLYLHHNRLGGALPASLGDLAHLRRLALNDNLFSGALPATLVNLDLWQAAASDTDLCEPAEADFQDWLAGLRHWQGPGVPCALVLSKQAATGAAAIGELAYALTVDNATAGPLSAIVLTDTLPASVTLLSALPPASQVAGATLTWDVGALPAAGGYSVTVQVQLPPTAGYLLNQAGVSGQGDSLLGAQARFAADAPLWADLNEDGQVDLLDILIAAARWETGAFDIVAVQRVAGAWAP